jgi:hypothetical protein
VNGLPVVIERRFRGPDWSGQGGYTCGLVAAAVGNPAEVRLRNPPPLGTPLELRPVESTDAVMLFDPTDCPVAEGWSLDELDIAVPTPGVGVDEASAGAAAYLDKEGHGEHPFPGCFGCGPEREEGDGLRIFAGPVPGRDGIFAAPWVPDTTHTDGESDEVRDEITWAALDCPTGAPVLLGLPPETAIVLGTMAAHIRTRPRADDVYVVMSWLEERAERVARGCAALLDERGETLAVARGAWVFVDRERFRGR